MTVVVKEVAQEVSAETSTLEVSAESVLPDGVSAVEISVIVKDGEENVLSERTVEIVSNRGSDDEISIINNITNQEGVAFFEIRSSVAGVANISAKVGDVVLSQAVSVTFEDEINEQIDNEAPLISEVLDGDIIQDKTSSNPFAVYIVKVVGDTKYIRHLVSLEIFNFYGHLKWENLKQVNSLSQYSMSAWIRANSGENGTAGPNDKVYEINGDQSKHWINMTAEDFLSHGGSEPAIYTVNQGELDLYTTGADVMSL